MNSVAVSDGAKKTGLQKDGLKAAARVGMTADSIVIRGGKPLKGRVDVRGAKNLATKAMVAALLADSPSVLKDVPEISDVNIVTGMLNAYGVAVTETAPGELRLDPSEVERAHFSKIDALAGSSRIPILFCGPLLHRLGEALIPDLGGCRIGDRPINFHLDALRAFGAIVDKSYEGIRLTAPNGLNGGRHRPAVPERRRHRAGAAHRGARQGHHRAAERRDRARDHGAHRDPAEDGRDHHGRAEPRDRDRGRREAQGLRPPLPVRPQRGRELGLRRARDQGRHLRRRREAERADDVPQRLPQGRRRVRRRARTASASTTRAATSSPCRSRPMCTPAS